MEAEHRGKDKAITYRIGRKKGHIRTGDGEPEPLETASSQSPFGRGVMHAVWRPLPVPPSRLVYAAYWSLPAFVFMMTWLLVYILVR